LPIRHAAASASLARAQEVPAAQLAVMIDWAACLDVCANEAAPSCWSLVRGWRAWREDRMRDIAARFLTEFNSLEGVLNWVAREVG
jgi:hypothetical protein